MKTVLCVMIPSLFILTACATKNHHTITPPTIVKAPDFSKLSTKSCRDGEFINTPAVLKLDKRGKVTDVYGLTIQDKKLAKQITTQFKKAIYTPYKHNGVPITRNLDVAIRLKCPG